MDETPAEQGSETLAEQGSKAPAEQGDKDLLLTRLLVAHEAWFDVSRDYEYAGRAFAGYAEFRSHGEKYVLVKRAKLWEVDAAEYLFFELRETLDMVQLQKLVQFMTQEAIKKVEPEPNHMSSYLSLVIIVDHLDDEVKRAIRKTRFRKNYLLGVRGWADLRLAAIDVRQGSVVTNGAGKEMKASLEANVRLQQPDRVKEGSTKL